MAITIEQIKQLREETNAGIMDCRKALEQANGDFNIALEALVQKGIAKAADRAERETSEGVVEVYSHGGGRVGVIVEVNCETDFVARSETFRNFAHEIALQIAASVPKYVSDEDIPEEVIQQETQSAREYALEEGKPENIIDKIVDGRIEKFKKENVLLRQEYIRDDELTIEKLLMQKVAAVGENIIIKRFERYEIGQSPKDEA
jgi:elongation factor Ts